MKQCIKCNELKRDDDFPKGKNSCKDCLKQYRKNYHIKNKEQTHAKQKIYYKNNRQEVLQYQKNYYHSENGKINSMYNTAKRRASKKKIEFSLTKEWITQQLIAQKFCCILTDIPFVFNETNSQLNPFIPSLDRINSSKGYTQDNTRIVCSIINLSLNEFGEQTFRQICEAYLNKSLPKA